MYYHCRPLKYVKYGKVLPPRKKDVDFMISSYTWLAHYCGYCPQIWLSRSRSTITGYKMGRDNILFEFDVIKGFPVSYRHWETILGVLINNNEFDKQNKAITEMFHSVISDSKKYKEELEVTFEDWIKSDCNLDKYLKDYLFQKVDQVVLPSINLKVAKKITCRNEKQKKKLRGMGFISDRIIIRSIPTGLRY